MKLLLLLSLHVVDTATAAAVSSTADVRAVCCFKACVYSVSCAKLRETCGAGVNISLTRVNVEVVIAGLPGVITVPAVSSPSPVAVLPPSPPTATSKSPGVPIGAVAGGIAGGVVVIGEPGPCLPYLHMLPHRLSTFFACVISISVCIQHECSYFIVASASCVYST